MTSLGAGCDIRDIQGHQEREPQRTMPASSRTPHAQSGAGTSGTRTSENDAGASGSCSLVSNSDLCTFASAEAFQQDVGRHHYARCDGDETYAAAHELEVPPPHYGAGCEAC